MPAGGSTLEVTPERYAQNLRKIRMSGCEIFKVAVRTLTRMIAVLPGASLCSGCKALLVVPHQANLRIIEGVANSIGILMDQMSVNLDRCGNTSAATILTALNLLFRKAVFGKG